VQVGPHVLGNTRRRLHIQQNRREPALDDIKRRNVSQRHRKCKLKSIHKKTKVRVTCNIILHLPKVSRFKTNQVKSKKAEIRA
jgi:hypothetical protein